MGLKPKIIGPIKPFTKVNGNMKYKMLYDFVFIFNAVRFI